MSETNKPIDVPISELLKILRDGGVRKFQNKEFLLEFADPPQEELPAPDPTGQDSTSPLRGFTRRPTGV